MRFPDKMVISAARYVLLALLLCGCRSDDNAVSPSAIEGRWILTEILSDPGDGSGVFMPVESDKELLILDDGTYTSNADVCSFGTRSGPSSSGLVLEDEIGFYIDCEWPFPNPLRLSRDGSSLILAFSCIEPCLQKFERKN